jgi:hypothetical protein
VLAHDASPCQLPLCATQARQSCAKGRKSQTSILSCKAQCTSHTAQRWRKQLPEQPRAARQVVVYPLGRRATAVQGACLMGRRATAVQARLAQQQQEEVPGHLQLGASVVWHWHCSLSRAALTLLLYWPQGMQLPVDLSSCSAMYSKESCSLCGVSTTEPRAPSLSQRARTMQSPENSWNSTATRCSCVTDANCHAAPVDANGFM